MGGVKVPQAPMGEDGGGRLGRRYSLPPGEGFGEGAVSPHRTIFRIFFVENTIF